MKVESIYDAQAIAREFHAMRNIAEWNAIFPPHAGQVDEETHPWRDSARAESS